MHRLAVSLAVTALALCTSVGQAQIPNLKRKAKEAGQHAVTGQQTDPQQHAPPKFDNTMLELNPQVVGRLIAGLEARSSARGAGGQTAGELRHRSTAASAEATSLNNEHSDDRGRWVRANEAAEGCVGEQLNNLEEQHATELHHRMAAMTGTNSPDNMKFMQDYSAAVQEAQQAVTANDTAAMRRAQDKLNKLMGVDPKADSAKARAACHVPAVPEWMRRADSLSALGDTLLVQARDAEVAGNAAAARAAEMTPAQFAMASERAEGFVALQRPGTVGSGYVFSSIEQQALSARLADLKKYFG